MIPSPDFYINIRLEYSAEVIRMVCAVVGFAIAVWGCTKIVGLIAKSAETTQSPSEHG